MENDPPKGWLDKRCAEAKKEVKRWPQWMQDAAKFEGPPHRQEGL